MAMTTTTQQLASSSFAPTAAAAARRGASDIAARPEGDSAAATLAAALAGASRYRHVKYKRRHADAVTILADWWRGRLACAAARATAAQLRRDIARAATVWQQFGHAYLARKRLFACKRGIGVLQRFARYRVACAARSQRQHREDVAVAYTDWKRLLFRVVRKYQAVREYRRRSKLLEDYTAHRLHVEANDNDTLIITLQWRYDTLMHKLCVAWGVEQRYYRRGLGILGAVPRGGGAAASAANAAESQLSRQPSGNMREVGGAAAAIGLPRAISSDALGSDTTATALGAGGRRRSAAASIGIEDSGSGMGALRLSGSGSQAKQKSQQDEAEEDDVDPIALLSPSMRLALIEAIKRARASAQRLKQRRERHALRIQRVWRGYWARKAVVAPLRECMEFMALFRDAARLHTLIDDKLAVRDAAEERQRELAAQEQQNHLRRLQGQQQRSSKFGSGMFGGSRLQLDSSSWGSGLPLLQQQQPLQTIAAAAAFTSGSGVFPPSSPADGDLSGRGVFFTGAAAAYAASGLYFANSAASCGAAGVTASSTFAAFQSGEGNNNGSSSSQPSNAALEPTEQQLHVQEQRRRDAADPRWRQHFHRFLSRDTHFFQDHEGKLPVVSKMM